MPIREPGWWYGERGRAVRLFLAPAAALYARAVVSRYARTKSYESRLPVICIGNLVAGGTGKTPFAMLVARLLIERGARPAFLSRGYGGRSRGPHLVDPRVDTAAEVGDEPLLLAGVAPTVVALDRAAGARLIEASDASHIIMDDGLQNASLRKDVVLAVVDGERWVGNGEAIPAGPLRAPLAFQAGLVDALVVTRTHGVSGQLSLPPALSAKFLCPIVGLSRQADGPTGWLRDKAWIAFAGIGRPDGFFAMLERLGARLAERIAFADHHAFTPADARRLLALAEVHGAGIVTTEKDLVRLDKADPDCATLKLSTRTIGLRLAIEKEDADRLGALLSRVVS